MPYQVQVGAQVVEFPDSVSQNEAQRILADQFPATGEDIAGAMQDPAFTPTQEDYLKYEEYSKNKQTDWITTAAQAADAAIGMIGGAVSEGAQGAAANPLNYIEGFAQGTRQLYGLAAQSQDPSSPLFKFKDLVAGTGSSESRYNQFLDARQFGITSARLERGEEGILVPPEYTNPEYVQGVSMILDPTLFVPGVGEILGASKLATRAVGKGAQLTGRAVAGAARPLERFAGAAERIAAETIGTTPEALRSVASTAGIAGALGIAPEAAAFAAIPAGIRTAREAGEALARAGENLMTQPSRIGPLEAIGAAPGANMRQRMLGVIGQYGGDAAVDASLRGLAGGIEGAAIGTGLGYLSGGQEGAAAGLGSGGVQGAAGALGGRAYQKLTGEAAREARAGDLGRFIDGQQDPTTKALFERVRDAHGVDTASALMDVEGLVKGKLGDIDIRYLSDVDFTDQFGGRARGVQVEIGDRPTLVINADILGKGKGDSPLYTLGHELFHALEKSEQLAGGATEIKNALVGRWIQEGDVIRKLADGVFNDAEIEARFNEYRDKLSAGSPQRADELAQFDTINKKADYIASELAAEHFAALIAGQKPDSMLKGFSGLTRQLLDAALTQNSSRAIANAAASIERTFGVKPTDSVLFPDLKQASPQLNAMLRDLVRARRKLDEKIILDTERGGRVLKPEDISNPLAAKELINLGLAKQMPDGTIRNLSSEEIRVREDRDVTSLRSIVEKVPGARLVDGEVLGRYSPEQLSAIEQSQTISSRMKDLIRGANLAIENGNSLFVTYFAALRRVKNKLTGKESPKYDSGIRVSEREFSPYSFRLTKADNPLVNAIDITLVRNQLTKLLKKDGSVGGLWGNVDGFMSDLAKYFTNLDQKEGARRSAEIFGVEKAKFLGDFVTSKEKSGGKFVRSFRLDRVGSMSPGEFRAKFSEEAYQLSKNRWMPAEKLGDKSVINSEEGYRIISGAKHKLYGTDGKLIGIYDTQTQAERKADATQTRLQPEVRQQQRPLGDEGRQATEAGGRNRIERGQEGQGEGGAVRQAGDVNKTDGLAILDGDLQLNLPKRPTVMEIATALQDRFKEPIDWKKSSDAQNKMLRDAVAQETARAVDLHPEAKGWYDENIKLTVDVLKELDPDISKPENDFIFKILLAATSDGNKVRPQFLQSWDEYTNWKNTGKISGQFVSGDRVSNIRKNLFKVEAMIQAVGWEKVRDFLTKKGTVSEIREALVKDFGLTKQEATKIGTSELADEVVPYAIVLGPKLGSFFNNLYGDFSSVTMDRWFMRTMGRLTGTQVDTSAFKKVRSLRATLRESISKLTSSEKEFLKISSDKIKGDNIDAAAKSISTRFAKKETRDRAAQLESEGRPFMEEVRKRSNALKKIQSPLVEAPLNGRHRRWIRQRIAEVQGELKSRGIELENADLQAVLWYLEKELYDKLNYRAKPGDSDYASAAAHLYERVVGQPSSVYAGATGRIRAVGGGGSDVAMGATNPAEARAAVGEQRYMPAGAEAAPKHYENVDSFREHWNSLGVRNMTDIRAKGTPYEHIRPSEIEVDKASRNKGLGTAFMEDLVAFADLTGKQIRINPSDELGATSKGRLEKFYKRFGFVENKPGKNKDYAISERFYRQPSSGERFMPASDTDYLSAVKKGDTATAQRMVDEAAKAAGYTVGPVFHGSAARFNQFKRAFLGSATGGKSSNEAFFFSTSDKTAKNYASYASEEGPIKELMRKADQAEAKGDWDLYDKLVGQAENLDFGTNAQELRQQRREQSKIYNVYLNGKFLEMDAEGMTPAELSSAKDFKGFDGSLTAALKSAKRKGYDGVVFRNLDDAPNLSDPSDHYAIFDPNKIKLSDAVTKDNAGNVIPLSQRFKATSEDIRYMPQPDSAMPGAYSFPGGYRALPGKAKGSLRLYGPAGSLIGIASSLDEAQRILRRKNK
jgi:GNAT superfamily N-acetyltransferase